MTNYAVYLLTGSDQATVPEALAVAGFTIAVVFGVLLLICVAIKIFSFIIGGIEKATSKKEEPVADTKPAATEAAAAPVAEEEFSSGSLKLKGCDEKTAAMIMAIVSDNTGIPLSELVFKSITLVENK
ncbi:MAG: OadG family protein [Clostridiales bacterium]|nr:OadG family protein [Clostridiales bacterium]